MNVFNGKLRLQDINDDTIVRLSELPSTKWGAKSIEQSFDAIDTKIERQFRSLKKTVFSSNPEKKLQYETLLKKSEEFAENFYILVVEENAAFKLKDLSKAPKIFEHSITNSGACIQTYTTSSWLAPLENIEAFNNAIEEQINIAKENKTTKDLIALTFDVD